MIAQEADLEYWKSIKDSQNPVFYEEYLKQFPDGIFAGLINARFKELEQESQRIESYEDLVANQLRLQQELADVTTERQELANTVEVIGAEREQYRAESAALGEKNLSLEQKLEELVSLKALLEQRVKSLGDERIALQRERSAITEENASLNRKLSALTQFQVQLESEVNDLALVLEKFEQDKERYGLTKTELDYLVAKHADEIMAFEKEKALLVENLQAFELLKGQYGDLEVAYNRLVRPARNMVGRYVVRVRYWKESGYFHYSLQEPDQVVETEVSEDELHERLSQLKAAHPGNLFTHVLFPGGKDLSHEEAYLFERSIVSRYDYYESD